MEGVERGTDPARAAKGWRDHAAPALALTAFALLVLGPAVFGEQALFGVDLRYHQFPLRQFLAEQVARGEAPLWWPEVSGGYPAHANGEGGLLYPLNVPLWALLGVVQATDVAALLHLIAFGLGAYALGRALDLERAGALFAALALTGGGVTAGALGWPSALATQAAGVWALVATLSAIAPDEQEGAPARRRRRVALAALAWGLAALAGRPPRLYMLAWLSLALASAAGARRGGRAAAQAVALLLVSGALGALLAAGQLAPTLELVRTSERAEGLSEAAAAVGSLTLDGPGLRLWLLGATEPRLLMGGRAESGHYLGLLTPLLALAGVALALRRRGDGRRDWRWVALLALGALGLLVALGPATPAFSAARTLLPGFASFRAPARALLWTSFALALLAGLALDRLAAGRAPRVRALLCGGALALLGLDLAPYARARAWLAPERAFLAHDPTLLADLRQAGRVAVVGLPPVVAPSLPAGPEAATAAVTRRETLAPNLAAAFGVRQATGYGSLASSRRARLLAGGDEATALDRLALAGTSHVLGPARFAHPRLSPQGTYLGGAVRLQALAAERIPPEAWLTTRAHRVAPGDLAAAEARLAGGAGYPEPVIEAQPGSRAGDPGAAASATPVPLARPSPRRFTGVVESDAGGWLVVQETWAPGWRARVSGVERQVVPANLAFLAVEVPPGRAEVELVYAPTSWTIGLIGSALGAAAIALALALPGRPASR